MQTLVSQEEVGCGLLASFPTLTRLAVLRDVEERGRDIEGCIKQWFAFVKPNFERYVEPQRKVAGRSVL
jgi:uridine kinase